jgi:hypothetical protein
MKPLNYTTKISATQTIGEIQAMLAKRKVRGISIDYDNDGNPTALTFTIMLNDVLVNFRLEPKYEGVLRLLKNVEPRYQTKAHARNVAWRTLQDWVEAQLNIIDAEIATLAQVFLPYAVAPDGRTLYEAFKESNGNFLLGSQKN